MKVIDYMSLKLIQDAQSDQQSLCEILCKNIQTGIFIRGRVLEQAVWVQENRYLIFTTDEIIYEESLNIYLIEMGQGVLDLLWIGQPYNTDNWSGLKIINDHSLSFSFLYSIDWKLTVYAKPKLRWSMSSWQFILQDFKLCRYLTLRQMPEDLLQ